MLTKYRQAIRDLRAPRGPVHETSLHVQEAVGWIFRAQDGTQDRGVSHSYAIGKSWAPSYPETTGYIIPTLLNWAAISGQAAPRERALQMADWERAVQLPDGSVMGSVVGGRVQKGVVFNTGQVLFGWLAAHRDSGREGHLESARSAAEWLMAGLSDAGTWTTHGNMGEDRVHAYNARVAWALLELWKRTGDDSYRTAMQRFVGWLLAQEVERGWFRHNDLTDEARPLLHTIAYTAQGLVECGILLDDEACVEAAARTADALVARVGNDGRMAGRFDSSWRPAARWACLTGMAQMAIVWNRLHELRGGDRYLEARTRVNGFLKRTQDCGSRDPGIRGGIKGSYPVYGEYGKYRLLNWATKFFIDSLLLDLRPGLTASPSYFGG